MRRFVCGVAALLLGVGVLLAAEIRGTIKSVDTDKNTITVTSDDKDIDIQVTSDTKFVRKGKDGENKEVKGGIMSKAVKTGTKVVVQTEKKDGKEVATEVRLTGGGKKKQQDK